MSETTPPDITPVYWWKMVHPDHGNVYAKLSSGVLLIARADNDLPISRWYGVLSPNTMLLYNWAVENNALPLSQAVDERAARNGVTLVTTEDPADATVEVPALPETPEPIAATGVPPDTGAPSETPAAAAVALPAEPEVVVAVPASTAVESPIPAPDLAEPAGIIADAELVAAEQEVAAATAAVAAAEEHVAAVRAKEALAGVIPLVVPTAP